MGWKTSRKLGQQNDRMHASLQPNSWNTDKRVTQTEKNYWKRLMRATKTSQNTNNDTITCFQYGVI